MVSVGPWEYSTKKRIICFRTDELPVKAFMCNKSSVFVQSARVALLCIIFIMILTGNYITFYEISQQSDNG